MGIYRAKALIPTPLPRVWEFIIDPRNQPLWVPYIESVAKAARRTFSGPAVWAPADEHLDQLYERNQAEHRAIRQALAAGSVSGARELAHEHVMHSFALLEAILAHVAADWVGSEEARRG